MSGEPFSFPVLIAKIPGGGKHFRLEADEAERRAVAEALGIVAVEALTANLDLRPASGEAFSLRGTLRASVVQTDVVTLEPVRQNVEEAIDATLAPAKSESPPKKRAPDPFEAESSDEHDVFWGGRIDLGVIVYEHLALALDPYPRSPGVEFPGHIEDDEAAASSAFAALAALKRDPE